MGRVHGDRRAAGRRGRRGLAVVVAAVATASAACGEIGTAVGVSVSGSSTVEPISSLVAELYYGVNDDVAVRVDGPGTGDGFQLFCAGETDISDASRAIKEEEAQACADSGIEYVELQIAIDGLSVITNPANRDLDCLGFEQLYGLLGPESEGFGRWSDANELVTELGGEGNLPDADLEIIGPGEESGTYDSFIELVFADIAEARVEAGAIDEHDAETTRPDYSSQSNDNAIIDGIKGSDTPLGWAGYAFAHENRDVVKTLAIDGGDGCVEPTPETIAAGTYPIARPLFIYVNRERAREKPAVAGYVDFYLSDEGYAAVAEAGYVQLERDAWRATAAKWRAAKD